MYHVQDSYISAIFRGWLECDCPEMEQGCASMRQARRPSLICKKPISAVYRLWDLRERAGRATVEYWIATLGNRLLAASLLADVADYLPSPPQLRSGLEDGLAAQHLYCHLGNDSGPVRGNTPFELDRYGWQSSVS